MFGALLAAGCIGLPPSRVAGSFALSGTELDPPAPTAEIDASFRPLAASSDLGHKVVDFGFGAHSAFAGRTRGAQSNPGAGWLVGPSGSVEGYPWISGSKEVVRLVVGADVRTLYEAESGSWGPFFAPRVGVDFAGYVDGCAADSDASGIWVGCGVGEAGVGAFLEGQVGAVDRNAFYSLGVSLAFRLPAGVVGGIPFPK